MEQRVRICSANRYFRKKLGLFFVLAKALYSCRIIFVFKDYIEFYYNVYTRTSMSLCLKWISKCTVYGAKFTHFQKKFDFLMKEYRDWESVPQSTYIYRVPQCMSLRRNWDSHSLSRQRVCPPPEPKGGGTLACGRGGGGVPIPTTEEKLSTLPTLWSVLYTVQYSWTVYFHIFFCGQCYSVQETINYW